MRSFIAIWFALSISLFSSTSFAAEISLDAQNIGVAISGEIVKGDYRKLIIFLRSSDRNLSLFMNRITLDSTGGDVIETMRIANLIESSFGSTYIPKNGRCFSACFILWASGANRNFEFSSKLGVHRINLTRDEISITKTEQAVFPLSQGVESYLLRVGIPRKILDKMNETSPTDIFLFDIHWLIDEDILWAVAYRPSFIDVAQKQCGPEPFSRAAKNRGPKPDNDTASRFTTCVDAVQVVNRNLEASTWSQLIYDKKVN